MVGLLVSLGAFAGYAEQQGDGAAASLLARFESLAKEVGKQHGMRPVKTSDGGLLLLGESQETAVRTAHALTLEFEPTDGSAPVHVAAAAGDAVQLENGETVELAARIRLTAHPGQLQPAVRT